MQFKRYPENELTNINQKYSKNLRHIQFFVTFGSKRREIVTKQEE